MNDLTEDDRMAVMAYVDGEMPDAERATFDARLAHEPALATAVKRAHALRAALQSAYAPMLDEPVPAGLLDLLALPDAAPAPSMHAANDAVAIGANDAHRAALPHAQRWRWQQWSAMAACLMLGVLVGTRVLAPQVSAGNADALALHVGTDGSITAQAGLRDALEQRVAGMQVAANSAVGVGLTFRDHDREYCRTFTLEGTSSGIACKQDGGWVVAHIEHSHGTPASAAGTYRTAASPFSPALLQAVDALRDGDTLDAAAESAARAKGWTP